MCMISQYTQLVPAFTPSQKMARKSKVYAANKKAPRCNKGDKLGRQIKGKKSKAVCRKRPLTEYQKFVQDFMHTTSNATFKQAATAWRHRV